MLRTGRVQSVVAGKHRVRVTFDDVDEGAEDFVSYDLPLLVQRPGDYALPTVDALAVCYLDEGIAGGGFILGFIYSDADSPPLSDADQRAIVSDDLRLGTAGATAFVALADLVKARLDTIQTTFDSHTHTTTATIGPSAVVGVISPPTSPIGTLADVAAEKVKAT